MRRFAMIAILSLGVLAHAYHLVRNGMHHFLGFLLVSLVALVMIGSALKKYAIKLLSREREGK
tara:strand:+ start:101 stop:289 length:189 start_codon:yes stop_codon:yes gene_type:complete